MKNTSSINFNLKCYMVLFVSLLAMVVFAIYLEAISGIKLSENWSVRCGFSSLNDIVKMESQAPIRPEFFY